MEGGILKKCDIGLLVSEYEGLPMAILEYGLAKLPIIATDVGQCSVVLENGKSGKIVNVNNIDELYQAILFFLNKRESNTFVSNMTNNIVNNYSKDAVLDKILSFYPHSKSKEEVLLTVTKFYTTYLTKKIPGQCRGSFICNRHNPFKRNN